MTTDSLKQEASEWIQWICDSANNDELREKYDQWAVDYDSKVSPIWTRVPEAAARTMSDHIEDKDSLLIDVGAGTGLGGEALALHGFKNMIGMDISPAMLEKAREKHVYHSTICCAIQDEAFAALGRAQGIVALGVFANSHAGPDDLVALERNIAHGGVIVFTVRRSFLSTIEPVITERSWELVSSEVIPVYDDPIHLLTFKISLETGA